MSGNNTASNTSNPFQGLAGGFGGQLGGYTAGNLQNIYGQPYPTWTTTTTGTTLTPIPPIPLTPDTAKDLIAQLEHDKVIVADHQLLFGQYMGKSLRDVPLEYIVQLGAALRGARISINKELRRRRCVERLTTHNGREGG